MNPARREWFRQTGGLTLAAGLGSSALTARAATAESPASPAESAAVLPATRRFPGVEGMVYLNSAAVHPWIDSATAAMQQYAQNKLTGSGGRINALASFGKLVNAPVEALAYAPSTSMGEYLVTRSLGLPESGGKVVTDALHFTGSFYLYEQYQRQGLEVEIVRMDPQHGINLNDLDQAITPGTRLVAISQVSLYNGFEHDLRAVCELAHAKGALVYADIIQAAGTVPVDLSASGVDFAACGTYKWLMGDFGFAFLYVKPELLPELQRPWYGYLQTANFVNPTTRLYPLDPTGEPPFESVPRDTVGGYFNGAFPARAVEAAAQAGIDWLLETGVANIQAWRQPLVDAARAELTDRGFECVTPEGTRTPILTFAYRNAESLAPRLEADNIKLTLRGNHIRISPSVFNTMDDIQALLDAIGNP